MVFSRFYSKFSSHVMPSRPPFPLERGPGGLGVPEGRGIKARASMAAVFLPFLLDEKGRKNQGRHHRSSPHSKRFPAMSAVAHAPNPGEGRRSQYCRLRETCHPYVGMWAKAWDLCFPKPSFASAPPRFGPSSPPNPVKRRRSHS